jgi:hypothetical protein
MQSQLTELEKRLYNKHLAISRSLKNKPFSLRKDFCDIVNTEKHKFLFRIATLITKHPEIDIDLFFKAPYSLYPDVNYFDLEYFSSMRAIKAYTTYKNTIVLQDPDNQLDSIKNSLKFITNFCIETNIHLHQYPYHRTADLYSWMIHYKENKINIFCLFEFSNIFSLIKELPEDIQRLFCFDFVNKFQHFFSLYTNSKQAKPYIKKTFPKLSAFVLENLNKPSPK